MNGQSLDQLLSHFDSKISIINDLFPLSQLYDKYNDNHKNEWQRSAMVDPIHLNHTIDGHLNHTKPDLKAISLMMVEMKTMTANMKTLLRQQRHDMTRHHTHCLSQLDVMARHCDHINGNIPAFLDNKGQSDEQKNQIGFKPQTKCPKSAKPVSNALPKTNQKAIKSNPNVRPSEELSKKCTKKVVVKEATVPTIAFITTQEFGSIPKYMLGRLSYEVINRSVADLNRTIQSKYKIVANYSTKYSDEDMRKYNQFKAQENSETDGEYFCTLNDLKDLSDAKVDTKVLTCLRHCKRIREIRGNPPKLIRYAIVKITTF